MTEVGESERSSRCAPCKYLSVTCHAQEPVYKSHNMTSLPRYSTTSTEQISNNNNFKSVSSLDLHFTLISGMVFHILIQG